MDFNTLYDIVKADLKLIILTAVCVIIDFMLGFTRAIINKNVESLKLKNGLYKILLYTAFIVLFIIIQWVFPSALTWDIGNTTISLSMITLLIVCFIEVTSISENSKQIPLLCALFSAVTSKIKSFISIAVKTEEIEDDNE